MTIQRVLIVDDSKTERMFLADFLCSQGMTVRTAENAEQAFLALKEEKPDLILMDVVMPGKSGFQLARILSHSSEYSSIPIIVCSSKNQETDKLWAMRQGARNYVTKPVSLTDLQEKIAMLS